MDDINKGNNLTKPAESHLKRWGEKLEKWDAKLDWFIDDAERLDAEAKKGYRKPVDNLKEMYKVAQSKLDSIRIRIAGSKKWKTLKEASMRLRQKDNEVSKKAIRRMKGIVHEQE